MSRREPLDASVVVAGKRNARSRRLKRRRIDSIAVFTALALLLAAGTFWAGLVVGRQQAFPAEEAAEPVFVSVSEQSVGRIYTLGVVVVQDSVPLSQNLLAGVLTDVSTAEAYTVGDVVYEIDGIPVRIVQGTRPFFRDMYEGVSGDDVRQLVDALVQMGYLSESGSNYSSSTAEAVRQWQRDTGATVTGTIVRGTLIAAPSLPTTLAVDTTDYQVGSILGGGEGLVLVPSATPEFRMPVTPGQEQTIPLGARVRVLFGATTWEAEVTGSDSDVNGNRALTLSGLDGASVCGDQCSELPQGENVTLMGTVEVVPSVTGPAIPIAALRVQPSGDVQVEVRVANDLGEQSSTNSTGAESTGSSTEPRTVTVLASQDGVAIIEGVSVGEQVLLFAAQGSDAGIGGAGRAPSTPGVSPSDDEADGGDLEDRPESGS